MKKRKVSAAVLILIWVITAAAALKGSTKLTYLEYQYENEKAQDYIQLKESDEYIEQKFSSPYDIVHGVSVSIGTFARDNNSIWNIALIDGSTGDIVYSKDYNASLIYDNAFHLFKFDKNVRVKKNEEYIIRITAKNVYEHTGLAFYVGSDTDLAPAVHNGEEAEESLCFAVYGGDFDIWWIAFAIVIGLALSVMVIRASYVSSKGIRPVDDKLTGSMAAAFIVLLLLNSFSGYGAFIDEWDNVRGGMIIARGGVLYKDYVTQHTPVMYYLCAVFALFGAGSLEQFRLSWYLFEAVIWGLLYARHADHFGKKKMLFLTVFECVFITSVLGEAQGYMVLSDGLQGLCMVALLLEFLRYYQDRKLNWSRCVVVSAAVWGSFGAAFISAYAIVFVLIAVIGLEIYWNRKNKITIHGLVDRYYRLVVCLVVPFAGAVIYFTVNHCLKRAFDQFYLFNREVYTQYNFMGDNLLEPFILSGRNFFGIIADKFNAIIGAAAANTDILQFVIAAFATAVIVTMLMRKRYAESLTMFAVMIFSASRGYGFHGIAAWYVAVMIIALFGEDILKTCIRKITVPVSVIIGIILVSTYAEAVGSNLLREQRPIIETESRVIALTEENEEIFIDASCCNSIYFCYKNRYPVNRVSYMLPWYMDWYEQDTIDDLNNKMPDIVVYNPDQEIWEKKHFANAFYIELTKNYTQFSEDPEAGWRYQVWKRN